MKPQIIVDRETGRVELVEIPQPSPSLVLEAMSFLRKRQAELQAMRNRALNLDTPRKKRA